MELKKSAQLMVYIPDTRGVVLSRYGRGNLKIGPGVYTYSRLPGQPGRPALGSLYEGKDEFPRHNNGKPHYAGTCPGSTPECERICYARRPVAEDGPVLNMWHVNSIQCDVPEIPEDCRQLRIHVSGDFDTVEYVAAWYHRLAARPDVQAWAYTRSWRVPALLAALERLRQLPTVQLFASMDKSTSELPPNEPYCSCGAQDSDHGRLAQHAHDCVLNLQSWKPWRRAWIDGDERSGVVHQIMAHTEKAETFRLFELQQTADHRKALICPEETKAVKNCEECGFCITGLRNDVVFLEH